MDDLEAKHKAHHEGLLEHLDEELAKVEDKKRKHREICCMLHEDIAGNAWRMKSHNIALNQARENQTQIFEGWKQVHQRNIADTNAWRDQLGALAVEIQERLAAVRFSVFSSLCALCCGWFLCVCVNLSS